MRLRIAQPFAFGPYFLVVIPAGDLLFAQTAAEY
jgi:hypothetical protein